MGRPRPFSLISYLMYDSLWTSLRFYELPQDYYVRKVLIYCLFMDSQRLSTLHGLCAAQTYKYSYVSGRRIMNLPITFYSLKSLSTRTSIKPPSIILLQV